MTLSHKYTTNVNYLLTHCWLNIKLLDKIFFSVIFAFNNVMNSQMGFWFL